MSDKSEIPVIENSNEWINWIEDAISKKHIKYYEYEDFHNLQKIGSGSFGKIYRANRENLQEYFALKSLFKTGCAAVKEIVREVV